MAKYEVVIREEVVYTVTMDALDDYLASELAWEYIGTDQNDLPDGVSVISQTLFGETDSVKEVQE